MDQRPAIHAVFRARARETFRALGRAVLPGRARDHARLIAFLAVQPPLPPADTTPRYQHHRFRME